ncbi:hypothetical protein KSP40_PGU001616 [Platanthera guangdongensis]|uniref:Uncharacterized protein n=1 Tax=Platanthera guangdongensis TaxID=2320717 RepID=A0ABR2LE85_9ASPA
MSISIDPHDATTPPIDSLRVEEYTGSRVPFEEALPMVFSGSEEYSVLIFMVASLLGAAVRHLYMHFPICQQETATSSDRKNISICINVAANTASLYSYASVVLSAKSKMSAAFFKLPPDSCCSLL